MTVTVWDVITLQNCNFLTSRTRVSELLDTPEILHAVRGQSLRSRKVALRGGGVGDWGSPPPREDILQSILLIFLIFLSIKYILNTPIDIFVLTEHWHCYDIYIYCDAFCSENISV